MSCIEEEDNGVPCKVGLGHGRRGDGPVAIASGCRVGTRRKQRRPDTMKVALTERKS